MTAQSYSEKNGRLFFSILWVMEQRKLLEDRACGASLSKIRPRCEDKRCSNFLCTYLTVSQYSTAIVCQRIDQYTMPCFSKPISKCSSGSDPHYLKHEIQEDHRIQSALKFWVAGRTKVSIIPFHSISSHRSLPFHRTRL